MKKLNLICILLALGSCAELEEFITGEEKPLSEEEFRNYSKMGANNYCNSRKTINCEEFADKKFCEEFTALDCNCVINSLYPKLTFEELKKLHNNAFINSNFPELDKFDYKGNDLNSLKKLRNNVFRNSNLPKNHTKSDEFNYINIDLNELIYNTKYGYSSVKKCVSDYVINDIKKDYEKDLRNHIQEVLSSKLIGKKEEEFTKNLITEEAWEKNKISFENLLKKEVYGRSEILPIKIIEKMAYTPEEIRSMSADKDGDRVEIWYDDEEYDYVLWHDYGSWWVDDSNLILEDRTDYAKGYYYDVEITRKTFFTKAEEDKMLKLWSINDRFKDAENGNITFFETPVNIEKYLLSSEIQKKLEKPQISGQTCYYAFVKIKKSISEFGWFKRASNEVEIKKFCEPVKKEIFDYKEDIIEWAKERGIY